MERAIIKFNDGMGAVLCSRCRKILREGGSMTQSDIKAMRGELLLPPQYCERHEGN